MEVFKIQDLTFSYPGSDRNVLDRVSLSVDEGEFILLMGRSGSGKTTLLNHLKSSMTPAGVRSGKVLYDGIDISETDPLVQSTDIGYVLQDPNGQTVTDKVWHELAFGAENIGMDPDIISRRIADTSYFFDIADWYDRNVNDLSGGQKQLVNLAAVMVLQPRVLILDEPTAQLDPVAANEFLNAVYRINTELGTTVIMTEHRVESVFNHADRIILMEDGKISADRPPREMYRIISSGDGSYVSFLPTVMQVFKELGGTGEVPMSVREGRRWLASVTEDFAGPERTYDKFYPPVPGENAIELKKIYFRYEKDSPDILRDLSITVPKGTVLSLIGGNGRGKSTLLRVISGASAPYSGKVILNSERRPAVLPQETGLLFSHDSVLEELQSVSDSEEEIRRVADMFSLNGILSNHPFDISMGQQQCLGLALLLLSGSDILMLDEVTGGLDPIFKRKIGELFGELKKMGKTILSVSHDIEFCSMYSDNVGMLFDGRIIGTDRPHRFFYSNSFYTTVGTRLSKGILTNTVNAEDIINLCRKEIAGSI